MTLTKDFKSGLLVIKDQIYFQAFLSQFNVNFQVNKYAREMFTDTTSIFKVHPQCHQLYP